MNFLRKISQIVVLCTALVTGQSYAGAIDLIGVNWGIDSDGSDNGTNILETEYFSYSSLTSVELDLGTGNFTDYAVLFSSNTGTALEGLYATGTMTGALAPAVGNYAAATFYAGTINWFSATNVPILTMELHYGEGSVNVNSTNGALDFQYLVKSVADDYFFVEQGGSWVDLADAMLLTDYYMAVDSLVQLADDDTVSYIDSFYNISESDLATAFGTIGIDYYTQVDPILGNGVLDGDYVTFNNGNTQLSIVPEPGMLSLMGLAFLGFAGFQSRRKRQLNS